MAEPRVPGNNQGDLRLPCGETIHPYELDLGLREIECDCGETHAIVMDVHPPERFLPDFLVETLQETIETADDFDSFGTPHLLGLVLEEFPEAVTVADRSDDGHVGWAMVWITDFDARRLHGIIVELVIELMEHAVSHADEAVLRDFESTMLSFDVEEFVDQYRETRDLSADDIPGYDAG